MPCFLAKKRTEIPIFFEAELRNGFLFGSLLLILFRPATFFPVCRACQLVSMFIDIRHANDLATTQGFKVSRSSVSLKYCFFAQFCSLVLSPVL